MLEWVQYPEDTTATCTEYEYDTMYRMAKAECTTDTGNSMSAQYAYTNDYLTSIQTPTTTYNFAYGDFGLRESVKIGERTLATYNYTEEAVNDRKYDLDRLDYGNGDKVQYEYDDKGRVTKQTYDDGDDTVTYTYDNNGALAKVKDSATGITTRYYYDLTDRMMKQVESGNGHSFSMDYTIDAKNRVTQCYEVMNGYARTSWYTYDDDNRITAYQKGWDKRHFVYDSVGRVKSEVQAYKSDNILTTRYTFAGNSTQMSDMESTAAGLDLELHYTYDDNGNILTINDGTNTTSYAYDSANQLIQENNQAGGFTHTWQYDAGGNILSRKEYAYTTGSLEGVIPTDTVTYTYGDSDWGDLLKYIDGTEIVYDQIGNPKSYNGWAFTWEHGRQLATAKKNNVEWTYTYDANGLRTKRTNNTDTYTYMYHNGQMLTMSANDLDMYFGYKPDGTPMSIVHQETVYYYITNLQGDVIGLIDREGALQVEYSYDAWGNILSITGPMADTLGADNPLRYRGYVYDLETGLYYLQSRYYDPEMGRFLNADAFTSTGQGLVGNNMFAYCNNNPIMLVDDRGTRPVLYTGREETEFERKWSFEQMKSSILTEQQKNGVMFLPNASGNGGHITNSYKITNAKIMREYADYLMNRSCLSDCFAGSVEGFVFEWEVHNVAYYFYSTIGNTEKTKSAMHLDIGKTIYADNHGRMSTLMFMGFGILYPHKAVADREIYDRLY